MKDEINGMRKENRCYEKGIKREWLRKSGRNYKEGKKSRVRKREEVGKRK